MNLYEYEGKQLFQTYEIPIPRGVVIQRHDFEHEEISIEDVYNTLGIQDVVVKAQVLSGKRGKHGGIIFCSSLSEVQAAVKTLFDMDICGQYVAAVYIEEKLDIVEEQYISITYDTNTKQPLLVYSTKGGGDIEEVDSTNIVTYGLDIRNFQLEIGDSIQDTALQDVVNKLWQCFLSEDCRQVEINPLVYTTDGKWIAADAKVALDDDAFYRHLEWEKLEPRTMMGRPPTAREVLVAEIDKGEKYYQGTAGKYIELDGDIALILNGGGASIANMDALIQVGLKPANYTEYSGNPPREKVYELAKLVMTKPGIRGLWACGVVANFTNVYETFQGFVDALDEVKPTYPIVVRRAGPGDTKGMELLRACAQRHGLNMILFGKEVPMGETAQVLADLVKK